MSQVKVQWVRPKDLYDEKPIWDNAELFIVPVIPLAARERRIQELERVNQG